MPMFKVRTEVCYFRDYLVEAESEEKARATYLANPSAHEPEGEDEYSGTTDFIEVEPLAEES